VLAKNLSFSAIKSHIGHYHCIVSSLQKIIAPQKKKNILLLPYVFNKMHISLKKTYGNWKAAEIKN